MIRETFEEIETVYVAGTDLANARWLMEHSPHRVADTAQAAYDAVGYFDAQDNEHHVYEFVTSTRVSMVNPPYNR